MFVRLCINLIEHYMSHSLECVNSEPKNKKNNPYPLFKFKLNDTWTTKCEMATKKMKQTQIAHTQLKQKTKKTIRSKIMLNGENEPKSRKKEVSNQLEHKPNVNRPHIKPFIKYFKENGFMNCYMHAVYIHSVGARQC